MQDPLSLKKTIKDVFYETRVLMGRSYTLRRFADEILGGSIDQVTLSCIENGTRFPSEATVRRLAAVRKQDPHELLVLLWRDRIVHGFSKELQKVLHAPRGITGIENAELAVLVSYAVAALPSDGTWIGVAKWRADYRREADRPVRGRRAGDAVAKQVEAILKERKLIEIRATRVRRMDRHFVARGAEEQQSLVLEFCGLFAKALLDKLALPDADTGTYLRNHYLDIAPDKLGEFRRELESSLNALARKYSVDPSAETFFMNVLVAATPI